MTRPVLARHLAGFGTTIFAEMSELAARTGAVNLGQGFPDTDGPPELLAAAHEAMRSGHNQYPPGAGIAPLRHAIAQHHRRWYHLDYDPDTEILVTAGATEAIAAAVLALCEPGDEVIGFEPFYDSYAATIAMAGGVRRPVTMRPPHFRFDVDALEAAVNRRTRLLLFNNPHNPTGSVASPEELTAIAELCVRHDLLVISDEVYEHLVFDGRHRPLASYPGMRERTISIGSAGKTFNCTGWKVGWIAAPAELTAAARTTKQFLTYVASGPLQYGVAAALQLGDDYFTALVEGLRLQRDVLCAGLASAGLEVFRPAATYFVTTDVRPLGFEDGLEFCRRLPELAGVVAIPVSVFYDDKIVGRPLVRFAFCKRPAVLNEAVTRLSRLAHHLEVPS
jgi:N-succinyldiaminopimelate aminotransferase